LPINATDDRVPGGWQIDDLSDDFEKAVFITGSYTNYSGAAHAELYTLAQCQRPSAATMQRWERRPERVPVWTAVLAAAGFATVPAFRAITPQGKGAGRMGLAYSMRNIGYMARHMGPPHESWY
jgi:hypothetical protein